MKSSVLAVAMYLGSTHARVGQGIIKPQKEQKPLIDLGDAVEGYGSLKTTYSVKKNPINREQKRMDMGDLLKDEGKEPECELDKSLGKGNYQCTLKNMDWDDWTDPYDQDKVTCMEELDSDGLVASCKMIIEEKDPFEMDAGLDTIETETPQQKLRNNRRRGNWDFMGKGMRRHDAPSQAKQYSSIEAAKAGFDAEQDSKSKPVTDSESEGSDSE